VSNFCLVSLLTEGESSVVKRYFRSTGLGNGGPLFASRTSTKNVYLHDETVQTWYTVSAGPVIPAHDIVGALQDIRITIATNGSHSRA